MRNQRGEVFLIAMLMALLLAPTGAFAQVTPPGLVNYQGVLRNAAGSPVPNGNYDMVFAFYDAPSGGTLLLTDSHLASGSGAVVASGGLFTVALGSGTLTAGSESTLSAVFANHASVYMGVRAGTDAEMTPRIQVLSAPYAQNASTFKGLYPSYFLDTSSAPQTKAGKLTLNGVTDYGILASGPTAGGRFQDSNSSGYASVGSGDDGINAYGNNSGGYFHGPASGYAYLGTSDTGITAGGNVEGGHFFDSNSSGSADVGIGDTGIQAFGNYAGGYFHTLASGQAYLGISDYGIRGYGSTAGGFFSGPASGQAYLGIGDWGIRSYGSGGGYFQELNGSGIAVVALNNHGIEGSGNDAGGYFFTNSGSYGKVGMSTYKLYGNGYVSFVQNHPTEKDRVIVYAAPEGDEVAVYTRGTAKLVNGEAKVKLGETFKWVTNPDIGLTAHLTPRGKAVPLAVTSLSTTELVVAGPDDVAFDYLVYGLRIGFEESSIVQEKQIESYIPSFKDHRERYAKYPDLRAYNALERFKGMESSLRGFSSASLDFSRAKALKDAIHEYDPATDPPVDKLYGFGHGSNLPESSQGSLPSARSTSPPTSAPQAAALQREAPAVQESPALTGATPAAQPPISTAAPRFPLSEPVEAGDVLVMDAHREGMLMRCIQAADPMLVGVAMEASGENVPVTVSGIVFVNVDASYAPVHRGDWLTPSPTPGHAMRTDSLVPGTILGKALESLGSGTGLIQVLVMLR